jgi:threonine synthase
MGANIKRVVVDGNEHDVKTLINALTTDQELSEKHFVSVRDNTIAALAHTIYTAYLWTLTSDLQNPPSIVVSGGKLKTVTSVLYAKRMGIPVHKIIIATNNDNTPQKYSKYGNFGKDGILSSFNADDRDSSRHNMPLIIHLCNGSVENFNTHFTVIDVPESKIAAMQTFFAHDFNYPMDHRTSLVLAAADSYQKSPNEQVMLFTSGSASRLSDDLLTKQFSHKRPATHVLSSRLDDLKSFLSRDASNS